MCTCATGPTATKVLYRSMCPAAQGKLRTMRRALRRAGTRGSTAPARRKVTLAPSKALPSRAASALSTKWRSVKVTAKTVGGAALRDAVPGSTPGWLVVYGMVGTSSSSSTGLMPPWGACITLTPASCTKPPSSALLLPSLAAAITRLARPPVKAALRRRCRSRFMSTSWGRPHTSRVVASFGPGMGSVSRLRCFTGGPGRDSRSPADAAGWACALLLPSPLYFTPRFNARSTRSLRPA